MLLDGFARPATGPGQRRRLPVGWKQMGLGTVINDLS